MTLERKHMLEGSSILRLGSTKEDMNASAILIWITIATNYGSDVSETSLHKEFSLAGLI